ncbi:MAG: tetratricopeptide repeat protein, partial [Archangium sp.]
IEARLTNLKKPDARDALWLRLARTWVWFAAEMLADGALARRICTTARSHVGEGVSRSSHALAFLRAEQVAHSRGGDAKEARRLADELIAVSKARGDAKEECVAWNARALLSLRDGALSTARRGFERSLDLARSIGFRRREAVAMHNLGLVLAYMGEYGASLACQDKYLQLSEQIGNRPARAYGPAAMALVYVQQLDVHRAEPAVLRARKAAEENGWPGLIAWTRHLSGLLKLQRHLERRDSLQLSLARADFLACLDLLEDRKAGWSEELDPAETAAFLALTWLCGGNEAQARSTLPRVEGYASGSPHSAQVLEALKALLARRAPVEAVDWFEQHGFFRSTELWRRVATYLELPVPSEERTPL